MDDLTDRTYLITGANTGIGLETARGLAERGAGLWLACRSEDRTRPVLEELASVSGGPVRFVGLDLGELDSVRACAETVLAAGEPLHGIVNNAGLAGRRGLTASGFELHFGVNYVGPWLLTELLRDRLAESGPARIVNVASGAHFSAKGIDFEAVTRPTKSLLGLSEYAVSKLACVLHAQELARRLAATGVTTYALHPGVIASDIWRQIPSPARQLATLRMRSPAEGARTPLYCATSPEVAGESGRYYDDCRPREASAVATPELGAELWRRTVEWIGGWAERPGDGQRGRVSAGAGSGRRTGARRPGRR